MPAIRGRTITSFGQMFASLSGGLSVEIVIIDEDAFITQELEASAFIAQELEEDSFIAQELGEDAFVATAWVVAGAKVIVSVAAVKPVINLTWLAIVPDVKRIHLPFQ